MIWIGDVIITDDVIKKNFVCNLNKCKGACCVEGDYGAPLADDELDMIKEVLPEVLPYMTEEGKQTIKKKGLYTYFDEAEEMGTSLNEDGSCAFLNKDAVTQISFCTIEKAWKDGKINWRKPISCHLYPIRIEKMDGLDALNYDQWSICSDACQLGNELQVPIYRFAKEAIVRKYGEEFYEELEAAVEYLSKQ
jgi:hypothetical protein